MRSISRLTAVILLAWGIVGLSIPAQAQDYNGFTLAYYERLLAREDVTGKKNHAIDWYIGGILSATVYVVAWHQSDAERTFFCPPEKIGLDVEVLRTLITKELAEHGEAWRRTPDVPLENIVVQALMRRHPCR